MAEPVDTLEADGEVKPTSENRWSRFNQWELTKLEAKQ
jgi:hypothetical protein